MEKNNNTLFLITLKILKFYSSNFEKNKKIISVNCYNKEIIILIFTERLKYVMLNKLMTVRIITKPLYTQSQI